MNQNWTEILGRFGLPILALLGIGYTLYKTVLPFVMRHFEANQAMLKEQLMMVEAARERQMAMSEQWRKEEKAEFLVALERRDRQSKDYAERTVTALDAITAEVKALTREVQRGSSSGGDR